MKKTLSSMIYHRRILHSYTHTYGDDEPRSNPEEKMFTLHFVLLIPLRNASNSSPLPPVMDKYQVRLFSLALVGHQSRRRINSKFKTRGLLFEIICNVVFFYGISNFMSYLISKLSLLNISETM